MDIGVLLYKFNQHDTTLVRHRLLSACMSYLLFFCFFACKHRLGDKYIERKAYDLCHDAALRVYAIDKNHELPDNSRKTTCLY